MIKAIIFDFDNCLAAAIEVGAELYQLAFEAMRAANDGTVSDQSMEAGFEACWRHPLDWVAKHYGFTDSMLAAGWEKFKNLEVRKPLQGYGDLHALQSLAVRKFLVTSGFGRLQESKIRALGADRFLDQVYIDAIDEGDHPGKRVLFEKIINENGYLAQEVLVVGDNAESEIEAGNQLGMPTVQILRKGVPRGNNARYYILSLNELPAITLFCSQ